MGELRAVGSRGKGSKSYSPVGVAGATIPAARTRSPAVHSATHGRLSHSICFA